MFLLQLGFTTFLTSQVISVAFYIEREKSDKYCSEALISAWGSFTCRKSKTRDQRLYFPAEEIHSQDFYALKNPSTPAGFEPANLESSRQYDNHGTIGSTIKVAFQRSPHKSIRRASREVAYVRNWNIHELKRL